jgi:uncharacterized LabA/DUF88 family protein
MATEKVAIYIDGGNFYRRLKDPQIAAPLGKIFDFNKFVNHLLNGRTLVSKRYYVGIVRDIDGSAKSVAMVRNQQKFLAELTNGGFTVKRGRIVYDHTIREKGVDVKLATDLVIGAFENIYDTAIIVSSDTDLIPAIEYVKYKKKKVEYIGFSHKPSLGMIKESDINVLLQKKDIDTFVL